MLKNRVSRRKFVKSAGAAAAGLGAAPLLGACGGEGSGNTYTELRILQWSHFVPAYDTWLDEIAQTWGDANGITVTIDRVPVAELIPMADGEFMAGEGHDLIEFVSPPSARENDVLDLRDLNEELQSSFGDQLEFGRKSSFNSKTGKWYAVNHGWTPYPHLYRKSMWEMVGMPNGPTTWEELRMYGSMIRDMNDGNVVVGLGMSDELDSNQSMRALLWSFGGSVQDEDNNVAINSPGTIAALEYARSLVMDAMNLEVEDIFNWTASSNNQALIAGRASIINNPISAYRTAQPMMGIGDDIFLTPTLAGPAMALTPPCCTYTYVVPNHSRNPNAAQDFIRNLVANYEDAVSAAALYNLATFPQTAPMQTSWLQDDPLMSMPADKLSVLADAGSTHSPFGYPGTANPAAGEVWDTNIITRMFRAVASGAMEPAAAIAAAEADIEMVYERWRGTGLV